MSKTSAAFASFRGQYAAKLLDSSLVRNADELRLIAQSDGRLSWSDGPGAPEEGQDPPSIDQKHPGLRLWVVDSTEVPYASECSEFGLALETGRLKHSNLTGGGPAHCGGELVAVSHDVIAINGSSGRYGARSRQELDAVAAAFRASGYGVWNYGYDLEANRPFNFELGSPEWVA